MDSGLIVALDLPTAEQAEELASRLDGLDLCFKIGLELYSSAGPDIVRNFTDKGRDVFVDLKLHDIPATVGRATARLAELGASLLTVHSSGGRAMMSAAVDATHKAAGDERLRVLAVTALTSLDQDDLQSIGVDMSIDELVVHRAVLAADSGCDGVVASPHEAGILRKSLPEGFLIVTPGVRPLGHDKGDQKRVMTPAKAKAAGADLIVVGRPIRDAEDARAAAMSIIEDFNA